MSVGGDWGAGYPTTESYSDTAEPRLSPASMDLCVLAAGHRPPRNGPAFRYCELGCGPAFTLIGLAALYPEAQFLGVDFMPEHVIQARDLIADAGLTNIEVIEASFSDLATAPPPEPFQYVASHGVWTWISPENQAALLALYDRWLAPGGIAYVGYASASLWSIAEPMRQIFAVAPQGPKGERFDNARKAMGAYIALGEAHPELGKMWEAMSTLPDSFIAHDLGAVHRRPLWPSELAAAVAPAKLSYVTSGVFNDRFDPLRFQGDALKFVQIAARQGWGETARDLVSRRGFRIDLFGRGAPPLTGQQIQQGLRGLTIAPWELPPSRDGGETVRFPEEMAQRIETALERGEQSFGAFCDSLGLDEVPALQTALMALGRGDARVVQPEKSAPAKTVAGFHEALRRRHAMHEVVPGIASPRLGEMVAIYEKEKAALFEDADADYARSLQDMYRLP